MNKNMYQLSGKKLFLIGCLLLGLAIVIILLMRPSGLISLKPIKIEKNERPPLLISNQSQNQPNNNLTVNTLNLFETTPEESKYECVQLKTKKGNAPICIYSTSQDRFISASLKQTGTWEAHLTLRLEKLFETERILNLIDIGANLGVYSITALKHNRLVLAVDANPNNAKHIRQSVKLGGFENMATIVVNAISDAYRYMKVKLPVDENIGGAHVYDAGKNDELAVKSVYMDDLLEVINFRRAAMKIDIETSEPQAFSHSAKFFSEIDIPYIFIEWQHIKATAGATQIKNMLESRGYSAYKNGKALTGDHKKWPYNIMWIRTKHHIFPAVKPF